MAAAKKNGNGGGKKEYDDANTIVVFRAKDATETNRKPVLWGRVNVEGVEYRLALWPREGAAGKFYSGQIEPIEGEETPKGKAKGKPAVGDEEFP